MPSDGRLVPRDAAVSTRLYDEGARGTASLPGPSLPRALASRAGLQMNADGSRRAATVEREAGLVTNLRVLLLRAIGGRDIASGGLLLTLSYFSLWVIRLAWKQIIEYLKRKLLVRAVIASQDEAYKWVMAWLSHHPDFTRGTAFTVSTSLKGFGTGSSFMGRGGGGSRRSGETGADAASSKKPHLFLLPAVGEHLLQFMGRRIYISRSEKQSTVAGPYGMSVQSTEALQLTAWVGSRHVIKDLIYEAYHAFQAQQSERTLIFTTDLMSHRDQWVQVGSRPIRPLTSIILPPQQIDALVADAEKFQGSESWYAEHGIPWRRGYLFYGPPGSGKTSLVTALAGRLHKSISVVDLSDPSLTDGMLRTLLNSASAGTLLLLEDLDAAFTKSRDPNGRERSLTFSGLLNAIDGVAAQEGRMLFMTTNHIERLSAALIRPGRVDVRLEFTHATEEQITEFFVRFYQGLSLAELAEPGAEEPPTLTTAGSSGACEAAAQPGGSATVLSAAQGENTPFAMQPEPVAEYSNDGNGDAAVATRPGSSGTSVMRVIARLQEHGLGAADVADQDGVAARDRVLTLLAQRFLNTVRGNAISVAQMQGHLMLHRLDPFMAVVTADTTAEQDALDKPADDAPGMPEPGSDAAPESIAAEVGEASEEPQNTAVASPPERGLRGRGRGGRRRDQQ